MAPPPPPPPPPGFAGPTGPGLGRPFSAGDAISYGWRSFQANAGPLVLVVLVILAVGIVMSLAGQSINNTFVLLAFSVLQLVVSLILGLGVIRASLAILDGRRPTVEDLLNLENLVPYAIASILVGLLVTAGLVLCIVPGLIVGFLLQFYGYAVIDHRVGVPAYGATTTTDPTRESDPIGAMRASYEIATQNVGSLLVLMLLCILINFAGALLCGIGLLVSVPITYIAVAYAWRFFTGGVIAGRQA